MEHLPAGKEWVYEPKWDGFRCVVFRDGKNVTLQSKAGRPLTRYFPELVSEVGAIKAKQFVLDGEIAIARNKDFSFDDLLQRIHPASSRIKTLAAETPALLITFDILVDAEGRSLVALPFEKRREALAGFIKRFCGNSKAIRLSPSSISFADAERWLLRVGATLDGVIAKRRDLAYRSGTRDGMQKIKLLRTADCVVGGFRYNEGKPLVGSLLLGLYDDEGKLHHVGFTSSIKNSDKPALTKTLKAAVGSPGFSGNAPGGPSRWSTKRSAEWVPLKPKFVVEVCYDHFSGERFRHGTKLLRWRPDKSPRQCTFAQVEQNGRSLLSLLK